MNTTNCFGFMMQIGRKTSFIVRKLNYTYDGLVAEVKDRDDGQLYEVTIKPKYVTVNDTPFCMDCNNTLTEEEAKEGDFCDKCYVKLQAEHIGELRHPDELGR